MNTNEGEVIHVEANSLQDHANGKRLFAKFKTPVNRAGGAKYSELVSVGIIEGGCANGEPSVSFLAFHEGETPEQDHWFMFETTANALRMLAQALEKATKHFNLNQGGSTQ